MKLDIIVAFNDVTITEKTSGLVGRNLKTFDGRAISIIDQMILLSRSLKNSWYGKVEYALYATHSSQLSEHSRTKLVNEGYSIHKMTENLLSDRVCNRINAYSDFTDGDFSLVVDCDLIFIKEEPNLNFTKMISAKLRGQLENGIFGETDNDKMWTRLYQACVINVPKEGELEYTLQYHSHFNNGAILVNNKYKNRFKELILFCRDKVIQIYPELRDYPKVKHFLEEIIVSLAILKSKNYSHMPSSFNAIVTQCTGDEDYSMIHYVSNGEINNLQGYGIQELAKKCLFK